MDTPNISAKEAKAAAKLAKANRRAAAKALEAPSLETHHQGTATVAASSSYNTDTAAGSSSGRITSGIADTRKPGPPKMAAGSSGGAAHANKAGGGGGASAAAGSVKQNNAACTAASVASASASSLNPLPYKLPHGSPTSAADLIRTIHPPPSSKMFKSQLLISSISRGLHPSVILLMQHLASHTLLGSSARAIATLAALRDFILDYYTPPGAVLNRDMVTKLGHQISGITSARPLGTSAGNAVRYLKYEISVVPAEMGEREAKSHLIDRIDHFVRDRIIFASRVISSHVAGKIKDPSTPGGAAADVILTFARSSVVEQAIVEAWKKGKRFEVICVGGETFEEGKRLLQSLLHHGIPTSYAPLISLSSILPRVSLVLLGTASLLANGALYSRAGTATVAMMAHYRKIPVIVCCETYKFSERVRLEGVGGNERADPSPLLPPGDDCPSNLSALNLLYDLTPPKYITAIASEAGLSGPESVAILLRDYKSILFGS